MGNLHGLTLTDGQAQACRMVERLLEREEPAFGVISGYAGTGKSTLLKVVAEEHGPPIILCPTGKAALRVTEATGLAASTVHRWMYKAMEDPKNGEVRWKKKPLDEIPFPGNGLVVIDEASMIAEDLWLDLWGMCSSIGVKVLLTGDPFQLPPVRRTSEGEWKSFSCLTDLKTDYRADLTEVVRQALDSPIIRASMMIRKGEDAAMEAVGDILESVPMERAVETFLAMGSNRALIAHTNATRRSLNLEVRKALGYHDYALRPGEPLLVLANNYQIDRFNGEVLRFEGWKETPGEPVAVRDRWKNLSAMLSFGIAQIEGANVILSQEEVFGQSEGMPESTIARGAKDYAVGYWGFDRKMSPSHLNANLGYSLTCHKSQGSEYDDVVVIAEKSVGGRPGIYGKEGRRWLYTATTRAKKRVVIAF